MMATNAPSSYSLQREKLAEYFDQTARQAWIELTGDSKVSGIRATVRSGREEMRNKLLNWLPEDLRRTRVLDAGCGTGAFSVAAACRGAEVLGIDVAPGLIKVAKERTPSFIGHGRIEWRAGDMSDPELGSFDHIVLMDSLIHYSAEDIVSTLSQLSQRCSQTIVFSFAPLTRSLSIMHKAGKLFPRSERSPAIRPISEMELRNRLSALAGWKIGRSERVSKGFYKSQAMELLRI